MRNLDELIEAERKRAAERITRLRRAAAAEQRRIDDRVIVLLREQTPDLYARLSSEAANALAAEKAKRSSRAKQSATRSLEVPSVSAGQTDEAAREEVAP